MLEKNITFLANKVFVHHWPQDAPKWSQSTEKLAEQLNDSSCKKLVILFGDSVQIGTCKFMNIRQIGITIPMFKREVRMIFEGQAEGFDAHVHVTASGNDYLNILNSMIIWRDKIEGHTMTFT